DVDLVALGDIESDGAKTGGGVALDAVIDGGLIVAGLLIIAADLVGVLLDLALVDGTVDLGLGLLFETAGFHLGVAGDRDRADAVFGGDLDHQIDGAGCAGLPLELDELEEPGAIERTDVAVELGLVKQRALLR